MDVEHQQIAEVEASLEFLQVRPCAPDVPAAPLCCSLVCWQHACLCISCDRFPVAHCLFVGAAMLHGITGHCQPFVLCFPCAGAP